MKFRKALLWMLPLGVVLILIILTILNQTEKRDPTEEFIKEHNYPYSGAYSESSTTISESDLTNKLASVPEITQYTENISATIQADNTVTLQCVLKDTEKLFGSVKQLSAFSSWASAFDGQNLTLKLATYEDEQNNLALEPSAVSIGSIQLDPKIISTMLSGVDYGKWIGTIPYNSVYFAEGSILFSGDLPEFLKQD